MACHDSRRQIRTIGNQARHTPLEEPAHVGFLVHRPHVDLQAALVRRYGGPSLMDVIGWLTD